MHRVITGREISETPREPAALTERGKSERVLSVRLLEMVVTQRRHTSKGVLCSVPVQRSESAKVLGPISVVSGAARRPLSRPSLHLVL